MSNLVIVAVPEKDDPVWRYSSEKVPHCTILFLGAVTETAPKIVDFVEHAVETMLHPFWLQETERGTLGPDEADVIFFEKKGWSIEGLQNFRSALLKNDTIKAAYDSATQFPEWTPHLTMGYPATPAKEDTRDYPGIHSVRFDRIAVWTGDFEGPEFKMKPYEYDGDMSMSDLRHHGVKGMRWGVRREQKKIEKSEAKFVKKANTVDAWVAVHNASADHFNSHIGEVNKKFPDDFSQEDFSNPSDRYKTYQDEVNKLSVESYRHGASQIRNKYNTVQYEAVDDGDGGITLSVKKVQHADDLPDPPDIKLTYKRDATGHVISFVSATADALQHHGVKGMKWGRRKSDSPSSVTVSEKGKELKVRGGENHPATAEAIRAASLNRVVKKSGTHALTNEELQAVATRMNLEQQVARLNKSNKTDSAGKAFVTAQLKDKRNQKVAAGWLVKSAVKAAAK